MGLDPGGRVWLAVDNAGGGLAKGPAYILVVGGEWRGGYLNEGVLRPGESVEHVATGLVVTATPGVDDYYLVVTCRDTSELLHGWTHKGDHDTFRTRILRRRTYPDSRGILLKFFPKIELDDLHFS